MKKLSSKQKLIIMIAIVTIFVIIGIALGISAIRVNISNGEYNSSNSDSRNGNLLPEYIKKGITLGGVTGTLESLDTSDATAKAEDIVWGKTAYVDGKKITGTYLTLGMLEIGDYVNYSPGSETASSYTLSTAESGYTSNQTIPKDTSLNWRVLSINDDGTVNLVSDTVTDTLVYYRGATGYNNGVWSLNNICSQLYSNSSLGATARSMTIEDIEAGMNEDGLDYVRSYANHIEGQTYTYTHYRYYPNLYAQENGSGIDTDTIKEDGINQSDSYYSEPTTETYTQASSSLTVTQKYYNRSMNSSYYKDGQIFYDLIHPGSYYWLASRYVIANSDSADFGLRRVTNSEVRGYSMFYSSGSTNSNSRYLRPVVSLKSNTRLSSGDGSSTSPYQFADWSLHKISQKVLIYS